MKISSSVLAKVSAASKVASKAATKASKTGAPKAEKDDGTKVLKAYNIAHVKDTIKAGLDGDTAWLGTEIADNLVTELRKNAEVLTSARLAATKNVLVVASPKWMARGPMLFAFKLSKMSGDIYERIDPRWKNAVVRGSIKALKATYGSAVKLVSPETAVKLLKTEKAHKDCRAAFGVT